MKINIHSFSFCEIDAISYTYWTLVIYFLFPPSIHFIHSTENLRTYRRKSNTTNNRRDCGTIFELRILMRGNEMKCGGSSLSLRRTVKKFQEMLIKGRRNAHMPNAALCCAVLCCAFGVGEIPKTNHINLLLR